MRKNSAFLPRCGSFYGSDNINSRFCNNFERVFTVGNIEQKNTVGEFLSDELCKRRRMFDNALRFFVRLEYVAAVQKCARIRGVPFFDIHFETLRNSVRGKGFKGAVYVFRRAVFIERAADGLFRQFKFTCGAVSRNVRKFRKQKHVFQTQVRHDRY